MRCGTVAIVGRTNVGKSTFLNACLGERIAIVSPLPQTTRDELLGVVHRPAAQIAFTDTPGFHRPKTELGRRMNQTALDTVRSHDAVVFMTDAVHVTRVPKRRRGNVPGLADADPIHPDDRRLLQLLPPEVPCLLVINKVDLVRDKERLLPLIAAFNEAHAFHATLPTSVIRPGGVEQVLAELERCLPESEASFDADTLTDKPTTFFVREYIREQVMLSTRREVPHAVAVSVERFDESNKLVRIQATIHVEKVGQRVILVGQRGSQIKHIGIAARERIEELLGKQVHLELFVRVTERWKDVPRQLRELGYETTGGRELSSLLPKTRRAKRPAPGPDGKAAPKSGGAQSKPGKAKPGNTRPGKAKPGNTKPGKAKPGKANPATGAGPAKKRTKPAHGPKPAGNGGRGAAGGQHGSKRTTPSKPAAPRRRSASRGGTGAKQ